MANANQLKALIKSHVEGDDDWFYSIALQLAADSARQGHSNLAKELKTIIDEGKTKNNSFKHNKNTVDINQPRGDLAGLLSIFYPKTLLNDMILSEEISDRVERILLEQKNSAKLRGFGLIPRNKILLIGPSGSGKTMTASALAGELNIPLFTILLDGLITKYMGETSAKLRIIFDTITKTRGVYLFDEFDSIGSKRENSNDVGEVRRILNSFLQFLEQNDSQSLIVAATNHPDLLDKALFRRFDDIIEYSLPSKELIQKLFKTKLFSLNTKKVKWSEILTHSEGLSYGDISKVCEDAAKNTILDNKEEVTTKCLLKAINFRKTILHK